MIEVFYFNAATSCAAKRPTADGTSGDAVASSRVMVLMIAEPTITPSASGAVPQPVPGAIFQIQRKWDVA